MIRDLAWIVHTPHETATGRSADFSPQQLPNAYGCGLESALRPHECALFGLGLARTLALPRLSFRARAESLDAGGWRCGWRWLLGRGLLFGMALLLGGSASAQNLLRNGDFESPLSTNDWVVQFSAPSIPSTDAYGGPGDFAIADRTTEGSRIAGGYGAHLRSRTDWCPAFAASGTRTRYRWHTWPHPHSCTRVSGSSPGGWPGHPPSACPSPR